MKRKRLGKRRIKNKNFEILIDCIISDLQLFQIWFPYTFHFLTGKLIFITVDYRSIREMNINLVGKQCIRLIERYNQIYKKDSEFMLCGPFLED